MIRLTDEELQKLVKEREEYPYVNFDYDQLLVNKVNSTESSFWIITEDFIVDRYFKKNPKTEWKISGIYQLDYIFYEIYCVQRNKDYSYERGDLVAYKLFHFSKNSFKKVEIGFDYSFEQKHFSYNMNFSDKYKEMGIKPEELLVPEYIKKKNKSEYVERYSVFLKKKIYLRFLDIVNVPCKNFFNKYICFLSRYKKSVTDFFGLPTEKEICKPLKDLVEFIEPHNIQPGDIYLIGYYLNTDLYKLNDIDDAFKPELRIIKHDNDIKYIQEEYIDLEGHVIIRCHDEKIRKYLCVYFYKNNTIIEDFFKYDVIPNASCLAEMPVFIPSDDLTKFNSFFELDDYYFLNNYESVIESKRVRFEQTKQIIDKDMSEFKSCFNSGAYKAALIMAGSILEAILIDWLSEEDDKDYFKEDYLIKGSNRYATLNDYIRILQEKYALREPNWNQGRAKADFIKEKRNLVHAKLFIKEKDINFDTCIQVYSYLQYIIDFRFNCKES